MSGLRILEILLRPFVALVLFGSAAYGGYLIERYGARRGWKGRFWRYITHRHPVAPRTREERRNWHGVVWVWVAIIAMFAALWLSDPVGHH